jgi:hypothetical protein
MRWIEPEAKPRSVPPSVTARMLRAAFERGQATPAQRNELAKALFWSGDYAAAAAEYEALVRDDPRHWAALTRIYLKLDRFDDAIAAAGRAEAARENIAWMRGKALHRLGRDAEAIAELKAQFAREPGLATLGELLLLLARQPDGHALLAACDSAPLGMANSTPVRAYRAIALSRLGREKDAAALVHLERHVMREALALPRGFATLDAFNHALAQEILVQPSPDSPVRDGLDITYEPFVSDSPAFIALHAALRGAMERYIASMHARGLDTVMPPPPEEGTLFTANVVLTKDGRNGEHIHGLGYISAVYHVVVPASVTQANDDRGALALGLCASHTGGYHPGWGIRYIKPEPGWLTIFPSHIFHDVVPSLSAAPRISVAADLRPGGEA